MLASAQFSRKAPRCTQQLYEAATRMFVAKTIFLWVMSFVKYVPILEKFQYVAKKNIKETPFQIKVLNFVCMISHAKQYSLTV